MRRFELPPVAFPIFLLAGVIAQGCSTGATNSSSDNSDGSESEIEPSTAADTSSNVESITESAQSTGQDTHSESRSHESSDDPSDSEDPDIDLPKFDLATFPDIQNEMLGCKAVDFLFVIDNSGSMADEQTNLVNSFPGFLKGIQETLTTDDWHIMVIDTDATATTTSPLCDFPEMGECTCFDDPACCEIACSDTKNKTCDENPCDMIPKPTCDKVLGAAKTTDLMGMSCNIEDDRPFMLSTDPQIEETFSCLARVGTLGNGEEQVMEAMLRALSSPLTDTDQCNDSFLRKDSVLVVTFITDEEEKEGAGSPGTPAQWKDRLVEMKGDEASIVVIGLYGDTGEPNAICEPFGEDQTTGAEASPRIRSFVQSFGDNGLSSSVCAPDFTSAFDEAVAKIDTVCDTWDPG